MLKEGNFDGFKALVQESGNSSYKFLQNIYASSEPDEQGVSLGLALSEKVLNGRGVCRVHGGGFAGTIQSFVPNDLTAEYKSTLEALFGEGSCYILSIRPLGGIQIG